MTEFYVNSEGKLIRAMSDNHPNPPENTIKIKVEPSNGRDIWNFTTEKWEPQPKEKVRSLDKLIDSLIAKKVIVREDAEI